MALRNSVSAAACVMVGLAMIGNVLKGTQDSGAERPRTSEKLAAAPAVNAPPSPTAAPASPPAVIVAEAQPVPASFAQSGIDDSLPTGSIDPGSGLHRPNPAAYGDAAKQGSSLILTGAEAINYLAGNTLRRQGPGEPLHFTYFASRGIMADGTEREFVARAWDRNRDELCEPGNDGTPACRPIQILLDAKEELQGGRLGTVTIGAVTAELVKGNVLRVPQHIPFIDSAVALDGSAAPSEGIGAGLAGLSDHTVAITTDAGADRRFVYYGADNRRLDVQPIEAGPGGGRAVKVAVGHWRLSKSTLCEASAATGPRETCFRSQPIGGGMVRLDPVAKGGQAMRIVPLPETRTRAVAED